MAGIDLGEHCSNVPRQPAACPLANTSGSPDDGQCRDIAEYELSLIQSLTRSMHMHQQDITEGHSAAATQDAITDPTRGRSAGTVENPLYDPTRGRSAGTVENPRYDPMDGRPAPTRRR
jgi:hypothetical protein